MWLASMLALQPVARIYNLSKAPPGAKIVHFVRHGQGSHNVAEDSGHSMEHWDARLTKTGQLQCSRLQEFVCATGTRISCVIVSPTTRALQTAEGVFGKSHEEGVQFVAHEEWRETVNYCCDARRSLTELKADFPFVDFSNVEGEADPIWAKYLDIFGDYESFTGHRESDDHPALAIRTRQALLTIARRPEQDIAVVAHQAIFMHMLDVYSQPGVVEFDDPDVKAFLQTPWRNCEMRSVALEFNRAAAEPEQGVKFSGRMNAGL